MSWIRGLGPWGGRVGAELTGRSLQHHGGRRLIGRDFSRMWRCSFVSYGVYLMCFLRWTVGLSERQAGLDATELCVLPPLLSLREHCARLNRHLAGSYCSVVPLPTAAYGLRRPRCFSNLLVASSHVHREVTFAETSEHLCSRRP